MAAEHYKLRGSAQIMAAWMQVSGLIDQVQRVPTTLLLAVASFLVLFSAVLVKSPKPPGLPPTF